MTATDTIEDKSSEPETEPWGFLRFLRPVPLSVLAMLYAVGVALVTWLDVDFTLGGERTAFPSGANIEHAFAVVLVGGALGLVLIGFLRRHRRVLALFLSAEAAVLAAAIVLVALDGATYEERYYRPAIGFCVCAGPERYTVTQHVGGLYVHWAVALGVLLVQAARVPKQRRRAEPRGSRYEQPGRSIPV